MAISTATATATANVTAVAGDTLDALLWRARGIGAEAIGAVLAINPGLAALGALLPAGQVVALPDLPRSSEPPVLDLVQLWT